MWDTPTHTPFIQRYVRLHNWGCVLDLCYLRCSAWQVRFQAYNKGLSKGESFRRQLVAFVWNQVSILVYLGSCWTRTLGQHTCRYKTIEWIRTARNWWSQSLSETHFKSAGQLSLQNCKRSCEWETWAGQMRRRWVSTLSYSGEQAAHIVLHQTSLGFYKSVHQT